METANLSIGGLYFQLYLLCETEVENGIKPFLADANEGSADVTVEFQYDTEIPEVSLTVSREADHVIVCYPPELSYQFASLRGYLMHLPMEEILLAHDRFFLHSSFITSLWGGILFSGNSGSGKSTQAELWKQYMGSTVINGDRAIVAKEKSGWRAYGSPYAGSSGYYVRQDEAVRAIILPEKAQENEAVRVSPAEAFQKLFLQISLDHRKPEQVDRLCDLLTELIAEVPVYRLRCTPDERAVETLAKALEADIGKV